MIGIKRVYEPPHPRDGARILVDRLWPRGLSKEAARVDHWMREVAPSDDLRRWYGHDPARFSEFRARYRTELREHPEEIALLRERAERGRVTLVYAAREGSLSNAAVLREFLEERRA